MAKTCPSEFSEEDLSIGNRRRAGYFCAGIEFPFEVARVQIKSIEGSVPASYEHQPVGYGRGCRDRTRRLEYHFLCTCSPIQRIKVSVVAPEANEFVGNGRRGRYEPTGFEDPFHDSGFYCHRIEGSVRAAKKNHLGSHCGDEEMGPSVANFKTVSPVRASSDHRFPSEVPK